MRFLWAVFLASVVVLIACAASNKQPKSNLEAAPEFLFDRRPFDFDCAEGRLDKAKPRGAACLSKPETRLVLADTRGRTHARYF